MGMYVDIFKAVQEDDNFVYYYYQFSRLDHTCEIKTASGKKRSQLIEVRGKLKIDKRNGDVYTIELVEGDNGAYAKCAAWALIRHWKKGEYPDTTYWAS